MSDNETLLDEATDKGTLVGRGKTVKGAHYAVFKYNERYFTGVFTSDNLEYVCGAEEIKEEQIKSYI